MYVTSSTASVPNSTGILETQLAAKPAVALTLALGSREKSLLTSLCAGSPDRAIVIVCLIVLVLATRAKLAVVAASALGCFCLDAVQIFALDRDLDGEGGSVSANGRYVRRDLVVYDVRIDRGLIR